MQKFLQRLIHSFETVQRFADKIIIHNRVQILFRRHIELIDFKSLLQVAFFQLNNVPVIPLEQRYPAGWVRYFAYNPHIIAKGIKSVVKVLKTD